MRAAVQVGYGDLESCVQLGEMPMPEPGLDDVVVRVAGTTVNRLAEDVRTLTGGRGADVALDCVGGAGWRQAINALARFGRMAICGATDGDRPDISIREVYQQHRRILGAPLGTRAEFRALVACLASGKLTPVVHATVPLVRIHDGLRMLQDRQCFGKVAVQVEGTSPGAPAARGVRGGVGD